MGICLCCERTKNGRREKVERGVQKPRAHILINLADIATGSEKVDGAIYPEVKPHLL